ncbi:MAG TPA: EamA family transporter [Planctomycetota bacterium]|nr:EamA family transporter [Planctomycetota bacterium]
MTFAVGECAALGTAVSWSISSLAFALASRRVGGLPTNQFRLLAAVPGLLLLHVVLLGELWPSLPAGDLLLLGASGLAGLVLGDLGYFYALAVIGPRTSSVLMATWPGMATAIIWACGTETPSLQMAGGVAVTFTGVVLVLLRGRDGSLWNEAPSPRQRRLAIAGALLGALGQAGGSVLVNIVAVRSTLPGLSAALVRMVAAAVGIVAVAALRGEAKAWLRVLADRRACGGALIGTLFGPILGVWLSMVALAHSPVGVAATLMATTPVFLMPIARVVYGARIGVLGVVGTLLAVGGVALLKLDWA